MAEAAASLADRLAAIEARLAIGDLVSRYALGADRRNDPAILGPLFAPDGSWSSEGFAVLKGREEVARGLAKLAEDAVLWSIHYMMSPIVELAADGRTATCQWYLWELCTMQTDAGPQDQWFGGWYDSKVTLTDEGWRFQDVKLDVRVQGEIAPPLFLKKRVED